MSGNWMYFGSRGVGDGSSLSMQHKPITEYVVGASGRNRTGTPG
jgi:hypothetical protein